MKYHGSTLRFASEAVIFLFPLLSECCAFTAAIYVKNSGVENGSALLFLLAAVKLAASLLEYKGFEEAYLANAFGLGSAFFRIGLLQLIQGIILPFIIIGFVRYVLFWPIDPLFMGLLIWTGILTSSRQFLSYQWRAKLKTSTSFPWKLFIEIAGSYLWLGLLTAVALRSKTPGNQVLLVLTTMSWKLWSVFVLCLLLFSIKKFGWELANGLSHRQWAASIGQAFTSQMSKEFFIMATTASLSSGFIARVVVTVYGLIVVYPLTFFRIRIFDRKVAVHSAETVGFKTADKAIRKLGLLLGAGCIILLPAVGYLHGLVKISFPFFPALLALGLTYPLVAFEVLAYFELINKGRRSLFSVAAATGGAFAIATGYIVARSTSDANILTLVFITILGVSDFIVNRVSKSLASR